jgi:hypothetical protein
MLFSIIFTLLFFNRNFNIFYWNIVLAIYKNWFLFFNRNIVFVINFYYIFLFNFKFLFIFRVFLIIRILLLFSTFFIFLFFLILIFFLFFIVTLLFLIRLRIIWDWQISFTTNYNWTFYGFVWFTINNYFLCCIIFNWNKFLFFNRWV